MAQENDDRFLNQIDAELRSVSNRLKKVVADAQVLLQEYSNGGQEAKDSDEEETAVRADGSQEAEGVGPEAKSAAP